MTTRRSRRRSSGRRMRCRLARCEISTRPSVRKTRKDLRSMLRPRLHVWPFSSERKRAQVSSACPGQEDANPVLSVVLACLRSDSRISVRDEKLLQTSLAGESGVRPGLWPGTPARKVPQPCSEVVHTFGQIVAERTLPGTHSTNPKGRRSCPDPLRVSRRLFLRPPRVEQFATAERRVSRLPGSSQRMQLSNVHEATNSEVVRAYVLAR